LVDACTDTYRTPKPPWRPRKEAFIKKLAGSPADCRLIVAADKLHNMQSMTRDFDELGVSLWERFTATPTDSLWYHATVTEVLRAGWEHPILKSLSDALEQFRGVVSASVGSAEVALE